MSGICLYGMNQKGLAVLDAILSEHRTAIDCVVGAQDGYVHRDFYDEIRDACFQKGVRFLDRAEANGLSPSCAIAVGWRWMIRDCQKLIVFHDSLLPRYRGFAPLPTALINGDGEVGVTALLGADEYDRGDIIAQRRLPVQYPAKIQDVIDRLTPLYAELACEIVDALAVGSKLTACPQDEGAATYSQWRDENDYRIDWSGDAAAIRRFIDAVGYPYLGACCDLDGVPARILQASVETDVRIEQRTPGKVMFIREGMPIVTCGTGMLRVVDARSHAGGESLLPLKKFRCRFR